MNKKSRINLVGKMDILDSISSKNENLYKEISRKVKINFKPNEPNADNAWTVIKSGNEYDVTAPDNVPSPEKFTHELLHIQLELNGFQSSIELVKSNFFLGWDPCLTAAINNNIAHFHMIAPFIQMGFNKDHFLANNLSNYEEQYQNEIQNITPKIDLQQYVSFLIQTNIEIEFFNKCLFRDMKEVSADLKSKNTFIEGETKKIVEKWIKTDSENNREVLLEIQKLYYTAIKKIREI